MKSFRDGPCWLPGVIADCLGPVSYLIRMRDGALWRRHVDHLREGKGVHGTEQSTAPDSDMDVVNSSSLALETQSHTERSQPHPESQTSPVPLDTTGQPTAMPESEDSLHAKNVPLVMSTPTDRYPSRTRKQPEQTLST